MADNTNQGLLDNVSLINKHYEKLAEISGENFNVFKLLRMENDEVRTHSRILADLLNLKGTHGQNEVFLQLFLEVLKIKEKRMDFDVSSSHVEIEKVIGKTNDDKTEGGRIDIILRDKYNNRIVIENKIFGPDQENQLLRYHNYYKSAIIFYLNLFGEPPIFNKEKLEPDKDFFIITYKDDIINWLQKCHEKTANLPILRETITQYIYLLKSLTNQTNHKEMATEIENLILKNESNFEAAMLIANEFDSVKKQLLETFWDDVIKTIIEKKLIPQDKIWRTKDDFNVRCPALFFNTNTPGISIGLEPLNGRHYNEKFNQLFIGIYDKQRTQIDNTGPFPEWRNLVQTDFNFGDIKKTLGQILPNSTKREEIKNQIVAIIEDYLKNHKEAKKLFSVEPN